MFYEDGMNCAAITHALDIHDRSRVPAWVRAYRREGAAAFSSPRGRPGKTPTVQSELERLRMENTLLKKYHTELRKLRLAQRNIG
jgi:transposase-like protein